MAATARLDFTRAERTGFGEAVYGPGKTVRQFVDILAAFHAKKVPVLATRVSAAQAAAAAAAPFKTAYDEVSRVLVSGWGRRPRPAGRLAVLTGGTADVAVAEECARTAEFNGARVDRYYDVGIAGLHRLLGVVDAVRRADVVVAVAGMEGALPSVVAGLVSAPVVAVPTSVGYGTGLKGLAAVLSMLNSCAEGVSVVNVDNGYGAALVALRALGIARRAHARRTVMRH